VVWAANTVAIRLTAAQATTFTNLTKAARSAFYGSQNTRDAAKAATNSNYLSNGQMKAGWRDRWD